MSKPEPNAAFAEMAPVFASLGDATRLGLVAQLLDGEAQSISQLSENADMTRQAVTKHLRVLEQAGVVTSRRVGRESRYAVQPAAINSARQFLERAAAQWEDAAQRLKDYLERNE